MVKPWVFEFFRAANEGDRSILDYTGRPALSAAELETHFDAYWDLWTKAEGYGFEGIFFSEHHFGPGYSPSPNLLIAALARQTRTLRLGVMGVVLAYYPIWRVLEEIGMLDQLCKGRLEVGTAAGIPPEMAQVGLSMAEAAERTLEAQELLDWALAHPGEPITHHGKYWNLEELFLTPPPHQRPAPRRWTTVVSEASARRSARRGTRICTGIISNDQAKRVVGAYREEAAAAGVEVAPDTVGLRRAVFVAKDGAAARAVGQQRQEEGRKFFEGVAGRAASHGPVPDATRKDVGGPTFSGDDFISGSPREVADQILEQCEAVGAGHMLAMFDTQRGVEGYAAAFNLFGQEVVPLLRRAK